MKKFIILFCVSLMLLFTGCTLGKESQAMQSLNDQIENIEKTISLTSTNEVVDVSPSISIDANSTTTSIQTYKATAYNNMMKEEAIRQDILSLTASLKSYTDQPYRLNTSQSNSIIELTNNINKNIHSIKSSIDEVKNNVKKIKRNLKDDNSINLEETECFYISLNNNMNSRYAYMSNIYSNLIHLHHLLDLQQDESSNADDIPAKTNQSQHKNTTNIDTFDNGNENVSTSNVPPSQPQTNQPIFNPQYPPYNNYYNNYNYNGAPFNPNRNTDTFYARHRNIDTYRFNPNNYYNGYYFNNTNQPYLPIA